MTATILHFTPQDEISAHENMMNFIGACRQSTVLGASTQFHLNIWDDGYRKAKTSKSRIVYSTLEAARQARPQPTPALPEPFLSFAKASLIYLQDRRPVVSQGPRLSALRCLEAALRRMGKDSRPTATDACILDAAVEIAYESVTPSVAYRIAGQLSLLADTMQELGVVNLRGRWLHGRKKPNEINSRISDAALMARQKKLPSAAAIRAIAGIYNEANSFSDTVVSSYCALMLCAPERVNEVMRLKIRCLVEGELRFHGKLGIRWPGSKLSDDTIKWLPSHMTALARDSLKRLENSSAAGRAVADWYTNNPKKLYLHEDALHLRNCELVSSKDISLILWGKGNLKGSVTTWIKSHGITPTGKVCGIYYYRLRDVESAVLRLLPETHPLVPGAPNLECREALSVCLLNELHKCKAKYLCMYQVISQSEINGRLVPSEKKPSIFERYGYTEEDGAKIHITTHGFRHYLNTLAQLGGLSDTEIAIFSGRKDIQQNRAYDHLTSDQVLAPVIKATATGFRGDLIARVGRQLVTRSEFMELGRSASHTTDFGYCMLDFAAEPCPNHRDCITCDEQVCVKGEAQKEQKLRTAKAEAEQALARARSALSEDEYGADLWVNYHSNRLSRIDELLNTINNPDIPIGARIWITKDSTPQICSEEDFFQPLKIALR